MPRAFLAFKGRYEKLRDDHNEMIRNYSIEDSKSTAHKSKSDSQDVKKITSNKGIRIWRPFSMDDEAYKESEEPNKVMESFMEIDKELDMSRKQKTGAIIEENCKSDYDCSQFLLTNREHVSRNSEDNILMPRPTEWCFCNHYHYHARELYAAEQTTASLRVPTLAAEFEYAGSKGYWFELMNGSNRIENGEAAVDYNNINKGGDDDNVRDDFAEGSGGLKGAKNDDIWRSYSSMCRSIDMLRRNNDATGVTKAILNTEGEFRQESGMKEMSDSKRCKVKRGQKDRKDCDRLLEKRERMDRNDTAIKTGEQAGKEENISNEEPQQIASSDRPYICNLCNKSFKRRSSLATHKFIHTDLKPHTCTTCGKKFLRKSDLKKHGLMHSGKKPYRCEKCGRQFSQSSNMLTHMRRHIGIRPFVCTKCDRSFFRKVDLRRHEGRHLVKKIKRKTSNN